jgi:ABC-type transport system involved in cytochrome c biogenesis permease subunit
MDLVYFEELMFTLAFVGYTLSAILFFVFVALKRDKVGKGAIGLTVAGFLIHTIAMVLRVIESGRLPFTNQFEFATSFAWGIVLCYLVLHFAYRFTGVGAFVMPIAFLVMGYASMLPNSEVCDYLSYRVIAFGYLMLTLVIVTGAIWAKYAWSRYWAWDPKETWSLITWLIYSVYIHLRFNRGWKGKPAAWFAVIGFISVIFTFIGVNNILPSIHSYR